MKRLPILLAVATLLLSTLAFPAILFGLEYDFEDPKQLDDWNVVSGDWTIENGKLVGTMPNEYTGIYVGDFGWTDYTFEVEATRVAGNYVYINFRVQENDSLDRYDFEASYSSNTMTIYSWINSAYNEIIPGGKPGRTAKPDGDTHIYRVEVSGNSIKAYVDDKLHFEFEDESFESGRIGLGGYGSTVQFDNLKITGTGIKAVDPACKLSVAWGRVKLGI